MKDMWSSDQIRPKAKDCSPDLPLAEGSLNMCQVNTIAISDADTIGPVSNASRSTKTLSCLVGNLVVPGVSSDANRGKMTLQRGQEYSPITIILYIPIHRAAATALRQREWPSNLYQFNLIAATRDNGLCRYLTCAGVFMKAARRRLLTATHMHRAAPYRA